MRVCGVSVRECVVYVCLFVCVRRLHSRQIPTMFDCFGYILQAKAVVSLNDKVLAVPSLGLRNGVPASGVFGWVVIPNARLLQ